MDGDDERGRALEIRQGEPVRGSQSRRQRLRLVRLRVDGKNKVDQGPDKLTIQQALL